MSIDAMKQALEALEYPGPSWPEGRVKAADALRAAIEQAEKQEPVAWMDVCDKGQRSSLRFWSEPDNKNEVGLYAAPPQRQPLTEIAEALRRHGLTLVKTAKGYDVMRLGEISAHGIGGGE